MIGIGTHRIGGLGPSRAPWLNRRMRSDLTNGRGRGGLSLWVTFSSGLAIRDFWLAAHGGGATLGWLLRSETIAFSLSAVSGLAALTSMSRASYRAEPKALRTATNAFGVAAVVLHGVRLAIYLGARRTKPR